MKGLFFMHECSPNEFPTLPRDLLDALSQPFAPQEVRLRPGTCEQMPDGHWRCRAVPFADRLAYEARLNALVPGQWSTTSPSIVVAQTRLVVAAQVQIGPIGHTAYGELLLPAPAAPDEAGAWVRTVPQTFAQAFIGACQRFGLGRYLVHLACEWVRYDSQRQAIALSTDEQLAHVHKLYQQAGVLMPPEPVVEQAGNRGPSEPTRQEPAETQAFSLRARDLAWVRGQCDGQPLRNILHHYGIASLEDLTDLQLVDVVANIRRYQRHAS
jgi:hypothetical protein